MSTAPRIDSTIRPLAGLLLIGLALLALWGQANMKAPGLPFLFGTVAGYTGLVVLVTSLIDWADRPRATRAYADFGRYFLAVGVVAAAAGLGAGLTQTREISQLLSPAQATPAGAIFGTALLVFAYLIQRTAGPQPEARKASAPAADTPLQVQVRPRSRQWLQGAFAAVLLATAAVLLYQRFQERQEFVGNYEQQNEIERAKAPPWPFAIEEFAPGTTPEVVRARMTQAGYKVYCPRNLAPNERIAPHNKVNCWAILKTAYGMPANIASFFFNDDGLANYLIRFAPDQWPAVSRLLDEKGKRVNGNFGRAGLGGPAIVGWHLENGLIQSAEADGDPEITMLWTARPQLIKDECASRYAALTAGKRRPKLDIESWWPGTECGGVGP